MKNECERVASRRWILVWLISTYWGGNTSWGVRGIKETERRKNRSTPHPLQNEISQAQCAWWCTAVFWHTNGRNIMKTVRDKDAIEKSKFQAMQPGRMSHLYIRGIPIHFRISSLYFAPQIGRPRKKCKVKQWSWKERRLNQKNDQSKSVFHVTGSFNYFYD